VAATALPTESAGDSASVCSRPVTQGASVSPYPGRSSAAGNARISSATWAGGVGAAP